MSQTRRTNLFEQIGENLVLTIPPCGDASEIPCICKPRLTCPACGKRIKQLWMDVRSYNRQTRPQSPFATTRKGRGTVAQRLRIHAHCCDKSRVWRVGLPVLVNGERIPAHPLLP